MVGGVCDVFKESICYIVIKQGIGNVVVIVIGGVVEFFDVCLGFYILILRNWKGFVKLVLQIG